MSAELLLCWICRKSPADSGEHKWLKSFFSHYVDPYYDWGELTHGDLSGAKFHTQSAGSKNLTLKVICRRCNNDVTQRADQEMKRLLDYAFSDQSFRQRGTALFSDAGVTCALDVYRYLVKSVYSRLVSYGYEAPQLASEFVGSGSRPLFTAAVVDFRFLNLQDYFYPHMLPTEADTHVDPTGVARGRFHYGWLGIEFAAALSNHQLATARPWQLSRLTLEPATLPQPDAECPLRT